MIYSITYRWNDSLTITISNFLICKCQYDDIPYLLQLGVLNVLEGSDREIDMRPGLAESDI